MKPHQKFLHLLVFLLAFTGTYSQNLMPKIRVIENADPSKMPNYVEPNGIINVVLDKPFSSKDLKLSINGEQFDELIEILNEGKLLQFKLSNQTTPDLWEEKFGEDEFRKNMNVRVISSDEKYKTDNVKPFMFVKMEKAKVVSINDDNQLDFGREFKIKLSNLNFNPSMQKDDELILYLNGRPYNNIVGNPNRQKNEVYFQMIMEKDTTKPDPWKRLVSSSKSNIINVEFGVGVKNGDSTKEGKKAEIKLYNINKNHGGLFYLLGIIVFMILGIVVLDSWLKQDVEAQTIGTPAYSYSKMQFLYWNAIVLSAYVYLFFQTWTLFPLSLSTLALITFSSLTTLSARLQDNYGSAASNKVVKNSQIIAMLSDSKGLTLQRLQSLFFNLIFGVYFIYTVFTKLSLVDFNYTQLAMIGISSATYSVLKTIEK